MELAEILDRIEQRLDATGLSATAASEKAGLSKDAIRNIRRAVADKKDAGASTRTLSALANALGTSLDWLMGGEETEPELRLQRRGQLLPVMKNGKVAAGVFREVDDFDQSAPERIWEPPDPRFPNARRMAFEVEGDSVNALEPRPIMPGDTLICVSFEDVAHEVRVRDGLVVIVERTRDGGHTREWSVKQVELYEDRTEFHPRSTNKSHKPIVVKRDAQADDGVTVEIIALVRTIRNDLPL